MKSCFFFSVLLAIAMLMGCHAQGKTSMIYPADSLAWEESAIGNITLPYGITYEDGEIYVIDISDSIFVYDVESHRCVRSFGGRGEGPGKFLMAQDIAPLPNGNLLVADTFHSQLQEITPDGEWISGSHITMPAVIDMEDDRIVIGTQNMHNASGIYELLPDSSYAQVFHVREWMEKQDIKLSWTFTRVKDYYVISIFEGGIPVFVSLDGVMQDVNFTLPHDAPYRYFWGRARPYRKGFLIPFICYTKDTKPGAKVEEGDILTFLVYYNIGGEKLHTYQLPLYCATVDCNKWVLDGDRAFLVDMLSGIVYEFIL